MQLTAVMPKETQPLGITRQHYWNLSRPNEQIPVATNLANNLTYPTPPSNMTKRNIGEESTNRRSNPKRSANIITQKDIEP